MNAISPEILKRIEEVEARNSELADEINNFARTVKLAAYAAEARRTLEAYSEAIAYFPDCEVFIKRTVSASRQWSTQEDVIGEVLTEAAMQIEQLASEIPTHFFELRAELKGGAK